MFCLYLRYITVGIFSFYIFLSFLNAQLRIRILSVRPVPMYVQVIYNISSYSWKAKNNYAVKYFSWKEFWPLRLTLNIFVYNFCPYLLLYPSEYFSRHICYKSFGKPFWCYILCILNLYLLYTKKLKKYVEFFISGIFLFFADRKKLLVYIIHILLYFNERVFFLHLAFVKFPVIGAISYLFITLYAHLTRTRDYPVHFKIMTERALTLVLLGIW